MHSVAMKNKTNQHLSWIRALVRPIVRLAVYLGVPVQGFMEAVRAEYLRVAERDLMKAGEKVNTSRLAVITGLHRREVQRLITDQPKEGATVGTLPARVLSRWESEKRYSSNRGAKALSFGGPESDFSQLVQLVSKDLHPGTVLFQLERSGSVAIEGDRVRMIKGSFNPSQDLEQGIGLLSGDLSDLVMAVQENLETVRPIPNLHAKTEFDNINPEAVPTIRKWFFEEGSKFHQRAREFLAKHDLDHQSQQPAEGSGSTGDSGSSGDSGSGVKLRAALGTFSVIEEIEPESVSKSTDSKARQRSRKES